MLIKYLLRFCYLAEHLGRNEYNLLMASKIFWICLNQRLIEKYSLSIIKAVISVVLDLVLRTGLSQNGQIPQTVSF